MIEYMGEIVNIELLSQLEFCHLITEDEISDDLPRCPDYPEGCDPVKLKNFLIV